MSTPLFPKRIHIEPSNFCNQKCYFCPRNVMERPEGNMKLEVFQKLIDDCVDYDPKIWLHFMGEPLLNPALPDMIHYAKAQGISEVGMSTNAAFLKSNKLEALLKTPLDRLEFSMDAVDREYFQHMRGVDEYEVVQENIREFLRRKYERGTPAPVTSIQFMKTKENEAQRETIVQQWKPHLQDDDFIMFIEEMDFVEFDRRTPVEAQYNRTPCNWLWQYCVVLWNGDVTLCASDFDGKDILGNVLEEPLVDIYNGERFAAYRKIHLEGRFQDIDNCAQCEVWKTMEFQGAEQPGYTNILMK